jgi:anti-sigma factor RsiW
VSQHLTDAQLRLFVQGNLDEPLAISSALHLDLCAHCATRAAHADPLAGAFAETLDPVVPDDLVAQILTRAAELSLESGDRTRFRPEVWAAGTLLAAAALLLGLTGGLTPWMADVGMSVRAALVGGGVLLSNSPVSAGTVASGATIALVLGAGLVVLRGRDRQR